MGMGNGAGVLLSTQPWYQKSKSFAPLEASKHSGQPICHDGDVHAYFGIRTLTFAVGVWPTYSWVAEIWGSCSRKGTRV